MKLPKLPPVIDWHDVLFSLLFVFVVAQIGACEVAPKAEAPKPAPAATQIPFKGGIAC